MTSRHLGLGVFALCALFSQPAGAERIERTSVSSEEIQGNGASHNASVSADGRFVAFYSLASNLVPGDTNNRSDVFVRDRFAGTVERVSVNSAEIQQGPGADTPSVAISGDGRFVAFVSGASNLVSGDTNGSPDVFLRDRRAGLTRRVSVDSSGYQADLGDDITLSLSPGGRYVAFASSAINLVPGDTNNATDIFVHDTLTGATERVSVSSDEAEGDPSQSNLTPAISADGRFVTFSSGAANLVPGDTNGARDIFLRDRVAGTTERVSLRSNEAELQHPSVAPAITGDGRFVVFVVLVPDSNPPHFQKAEYYLRDRQRGVTERIDRAGLDNLDGSLYSTPSISADGRYVAFSTNATNRYGDEVEKVLIRDRISQLTDRPYPVDSIGQPPKYTHNPSISADGRFIAFESNNLLVQGDSNDAEDVFVSDRNVLPEGRDDLVVDFGARGLWQLLDHTNWVQINPGSPSVIVAAPIDFGEENHELVAGFAGGLFARFNNAGEWRRWHTWTPVRLVAGDFDFDFSRREEIAVDFGAKGLWLFNRENKQWLKVHASGSKGLKVGDLDGNRSDELVANFGSDGLWARYNNYSWIKLHDDSPVRLAIGDLNGNGQDEVIADFGSKGLFVRYNNAGRFVKIHPGPTQGLAAGNLDGKGADDVVADLGSSGLWAYYNNRAPWVRLDTRSPTNIVAVDLDSNGKDDVVVDFGATGVWARYNDSGPFLQLRAWPSQSITAAAFEQR